MSSPSKIAAAPPSSSARGQLFRAAIVGAATLKGKEVAEMLNERNFPAVDIRLLDDDESIGQLEATGDEINFIQSVRAEQFTHMDFTFFAADAECTRKNWKRARDAGSAIIDLSGAFEEEPGATVRSLWTWSASAEEMWQPELQPAPCVVAHPAAVTLALLLLRARKAGAIRPAWSRRSSSPPPSRGRRAWTSCTSRPSICYRSSPLPKDVFDEQVAFNMIARYGQKSRLVARVAGSAGAPPLPEDCGG
jgi:aspartate-semialdehyde dehydrogenase